MSSVLPLPLTLRLLRSLCCAEALNMSCGASDVSMEEDIGANSKSAAGDSCRCKHISGEVGEARLSRRARRNELRCGVHAR